MREKQWCILFLKCFFVCLSSSITICIHSFHVDVEFVEEDEDPLDERTDFGTGPALATISSKVD